MMYDDYPEWTVYMNAIKNMYKSNPITIDIAGSIDSISKIDKEVLYKCYNTFYNPSNMVMCFAGDFEPEEIIKEVKKRIVPEYENLGNRGEIKRIYPEEQKEIVQTEKEQTMEVSMPLFVIGIKEPLEECTNVDEKVVIRKHIAIEILKLTNGTKIRRNTLFKLTMEKAEDFLSDKELEIVKDFKTQEIESSEVLSFDEQYISIIG